MYIYKGILGRGGDGGGGGGCKERYVVKVEVTPALVWSLSLLKVTGEHFDFCWYTISLCSVPGYSMRTITIIKVNDSIPV